MNINGERHELSYEYFSRKSSLFWSYQGMLSFGDLIYDGQSQGEQIKKIKFKIKCGNDFYQEHRVLYGLALYSKVDYFLPMS
jgi:hypothetical protein